MKRLVILTILRMCGEALLLTMVAGIIIGIIGYRNQWDASIQYSNAFFIAGCLLIIAGGSSKMTAGADWESSQTLYAESFRGMSNSERANFIIDASSSYRLVILGLLSGITLIIISALVWKFF
jgi:hypothetical protein